MGDNSAQSDQAISIILACAGQRELTELCFQALLRHAEHRQELIVIDVGSSDGTAEFLRGVATAAPFSMRVIGVGREADIGHAYSAAMRCARGDYVALLSNDVLVTPEWGRQLIALVECDDSIGVVGPMSNFGPDGQRVGLIPWQVRNQGQIARESADWAEASVLLDQIDAFAVQWRESHRGEWCETNILSWNCVLLKRSVFNSLAGKFASNGLGIASVEMSARVRDAGVRLAFCKDLFVFTFGTKPVE